MIKVKIFTGTPSEIEIAFNAWSDASTENAINQVSYDNGALVVFYVQVTPELRALMEGQKGPGTPKREGNIIQLPVGARVKS